ncbi:hypothetical protein Pmani_001115 [Petrolisthes manimaculis]|uniref:Uncharacterized protein n=1 Tax=Petrolisthes manimaculis TaxID=1843537 RepID=A0AAE1QKB7_9EUCA|nr:hypothetical protein Pmani_001115 [Petrolisthes manimaculis]
MFNLEGLNKHVMEIPKRRFEGGDFHDFVDEVTSLWEEQTVDRLLWATKPLHLIHFEHLKRDPMTHLRNLLDFLSILSLSLLYIVLPSAFSPYPSFTSSFLQPYLPFLSSHTTSSFSPFAPFPHYFLRQSISSFSVPVNEGRLACLASHMNGAFKRNSTSATFNPFNAEEKKRFANVVRRVDRLLKVLGYPTMPLDNRLW